MSKLESVKLLKPPKNLDANLSELQFKMIASGITVSDGIVWQKKVYRSGRETVSVSKELGHCDPIISVFGNEGTLDKLLEE